MTMEKEAFAVESHLPKDLLSRSSLRGNEYAWKILDIPEVIEAGRNAGLINIGGQLQFRLPDGGTCECYWVEVDTFKSVPAAISLSWEERVAKTADAALEDFASLQKRYNFLEEGRRDYGKYLDEIAQNGGDPAEAMCFVWYLADANRMARTGKPRRE
jgi:hypothetical protein